MSADAYIQWCASNAPPRRLRTIDQCVVHPETHRLGQLMRSRPSGPVLAIEPLAVLVVARSFLQAPSHRSDDAEFVSDWSRLSVKKPTSMDINESRFLKWAQASDWNAFLNATITGLRVLTTHKRPVGMASLYRWVCVRHRDTHHFMWSAAENFYAVRDGANRGAEQNE